MSNWIKQSEWIESMIVVDLGFVEKSVKVKQKSLIKDGNIIYNIVENLGTYDWNRYEDEYGDEDEDEREKIKENRKNFDIEFNKRYNYIDLLYFEQSPIDDYSDDMETFESTVSGDSIRLWFNLIKGYDNEKKLTDDEEDELFELWNEVWRDWSESTFKYIVVLQNKKTNQDIKIEIDLKNDGDDGEWYRWKGINLGNIRFIFSEYEISKLYLEDMIPFDKKQNKSNYVKFQKILDELPKLCDWILLLNKFD